MQKALYHLHVEIYIKELVHLRWQLLLLPFIWRKKYIQRKKYMDNRVHGQTQRESIAEIDCQRGKQMLFFCERHKTQTNVTRLK